jgi:uncharacterized damage-inducible protein DinB
MGLSEMLLPEFDQEMGNTRKVLERLPDDKWSWKPHPKSWALGGLATHLANLPNWIGYTVDQDSLDIAPVGQPAYQEPEAPNRKAALERFDTNVKAGRAKIAGASDQTLLGNWTLLAGGKSVFTLPKIAVLRSFVMNHIIHHRAQMGVYLRLNDVPVPSIYGPSADEGGM